jgi:hypothetical protein
MDWILKFVSPYELRARVLPGMLLVLPIAMAAIAWVPGMDVFTSLATVATACLPAGYIVGQWMRDRAEPHQSALFDSWGGAPTTIILRWNDLTIPPMQKEQIRSRLQRLEDHPWPTAIDTAAAPQHADQCFQSLVAKVLADARTHQDGYERLNLANAHYGFLRNCLYSRSLALSVCAACIALSILAPATGFGSSWRVGIAAALFCAAALIYWLSAVNERRLRVTANAFAIEVFRHLPTYAKNHSV